MVLQTIGFCTQRASSYGDVPAEPGTATPTSGSRRKFGVRRLQESAHSMLLSVAVFAGLSGRTNRFGPLFSPPLASLADGLSCPLGSFVSHFSKRETS